MVTIQTLALVCGIGSAGLSVSGAALALGVNRLPLLARQECFHLGTFAAQPDALTGSFDRLDWLAIESLQKDCLGY